MDIRKQSIGSKFNLSPSYGAQFNFSTVASDFAMGHNHSIKMANGINALSMSANLKFTELTDNEANSGIAFLQNPFHYNAPTYQSMGAKFTNQQLPAFQFENSIADQYNQYLYFYCTKFNHTKTFYNSNEISATFECAAPSILDSVEPKLDYDSRSFHGLLSFTSQSASDTPSSASATFYIEDPSYKNSATIKKGQHIFESGSYRSVIAQADSAIANGSTYSATTLARFGMGASTALALRDNTRNSIFLNSSKIGFINEYPFSPIQDDPNGGSSNHKISYRMFDHYPSYTWAIQHAPKFKSSNVLDVYKRYSLYGFNANLSNLSLEFKNRTEEEANRILLFLESHLGHKKFGFHLPQHYKNPSLSATAHTTPHNKTYSTFVCPDWSHTIVYKDNHTISATFIECVPY